MMRSLGRARCLFFAACVALGVTSATRADHTPEAGPLPGHSVHGDTFDEGPRRAAYLMQGVGNVSFPVTTKSAEAQPFFNQGVAQLHGFWYLEAERSFRQVAALDPDCAMAYWGMAMANFNNAKRFKGFIAQAVKRKDAAKLTPKEVRWIDALAMLHAEEPKSDGQRKKNVLSALKKMTADFPDDVEVKAFYVRYAWEWRGTSETKLTDYNAVDKVLDEIFAKAPDHPAHHYRIHLWDDKDAKKAIVAAAKLGPAAPGVAHMWHMPGHTYSKLNRYADAAWQQEASARVDHAYTIRDRVMPYEIHNYAHNNEWLVRDLVFVGRVRDAIDLAKNMVELPRHPKYNSETNRGSGTEYGRSRLIDVLAQHEMWEEYLTLCETVYLNEDGDADQRLKKVRYQGVASAALGRTEDARKHLATLRGMRTKAEAEAKAATTRPSTRPGTRPVAAGPSTRPTTQPAVAARPTTRPAQASATTRPSGGRRGGGGGGDKVANTDRAIAHVEGQLAIAKGDFAKGAELLAKADARKEHQSQAFLKAGNKAKAEELAKKAVDDGKGQAYPLANQVAILHALGKAEDAKKAFEKLRDDSEGIDLTVPAYAKLAPIAASLGLPRDWRKPRVWATDIGHRPPLEKLGPFRWTPPAAPTFAATGADGTPVSLAAYRGRPVVVIFYLGHGCLHCAEQLNAFAPKAKDFADAGVALVAVSTDGPGELSKAWAKTKLQGDAFPFPLVSDAGLDLFREYRCYDDFEKVPLHGTFLIDAHGLIRWRDIGHQPFQDVAFLVKESKRLLAQGGK